MTDSDEARASSEAHAPERGSGPRVVVVLPAYNEAENLGALLDAIDHAMRESGTECGVIVVDDGSTDATAQVARDRAARMPITLEQHATNQGLAATIRDGLEAATASCRDDDVVVTMDADNTHPPQLIPRLVGLLDAGSDVAIASRYRRGARVCGVPLHRRLLSWLASVLFRLVFPIRGVRDYTCGYRAYRAGALRAAFERRGGAFLRDEGFQCMVDILLTLHGLGARCAEAPLELRYDRKAGESKMKVGRTILGTLRLMLRRRLGR